MTDKVKAKVTAKLPTDTSSVDAGWRSRKLYLGIFFGGLIILIDSFLMLVAMTGWLISANKDVLAVVTKFEPMHWLIGLSIGVLWIGICIGLISFDKLLDFARECLPIVKAKFGIAEKPKPTP